MVDGRRFIEALRALQKSLQGHNAAGVNFVDHHSYNGVPLSSSDIGHTAAVIAEEMDAVDWGSLPEEFQVRLNDLAEKIERATSQLVPNIIGSPHVAPALLTMLFGVETMIIAALPASALAQNLRLPSSVSRDVASAQRRLTQVTKGIENLDEKVAAIQKAYQAAEQLPTTLNDLDDAVADIGSLKSQAEELSSQIRKSADSAATLKVELDAIKVKADETLDRVQEAFRAATSQGLAKEFKEKAGRLEKSMYGWAVALVVALVVAVVIGSNRFPLIIEAAERVAPDKPLAWTPLIVQLIVGFLGLAAPVWLAWIATKQIGQRFRLAEDYAYKAALSSAYEGYRNEAVALDPMLQAQLFSIALTRLDEIPLRLVEQDVPGSPLHEILRSAEFKAAISAVPSFKDRVLATLSAFPKQWFGSALDNPASTDDATGSASGSKQP